MTRLGMALISGIGDDYLGKGKPLSWFESLDKLLDDYYNYPSHNYHDWEYNHGV